MSGIVPGELLPADEPVRINGGRETTTVTVENTGDRPVQVGSHFHFFEINPGLRFDRERSYGYRLNVPAGTAVRFEPGQKREVELVAIGGDRIVRGMSGLVEGPLDDEEVRERATERARERGFLGIGAEESAVGGNER
ncbi:urease subunit beta [Natronococcus jeotgali]|uniref:Urease subunit beta n=1 Tax=Natronococcus jeotgali DSM 18795 TaxID=1227498 RepID=L9WVD5_9EURY|nr:urease subunit beta [Natronococcus jeotgali]ELY53141.1 urease subunit beta [Natronococcus jeotgali DSM 18795]